jgi:glycosyltransferase involved in cell wall biosynthesis/GNAT superfamily N-acetyltransferase
MRPPPVQIEELAPRHRKALSRLFADIVANGDEAAFHPHPLTEEEAGWLCRTQGLDQYFVAMSAGEAVAYGMLRGWEEGFTEPSLGLAIHPLRHRQGLGRRMGAFLIDVARQRGADSLRLSVYANNEAALGLYKSLGFSLTPVSEGKFLGRLYFSDTPISSQLKVGVCADGLIGWGGGMDLLVNMVRAMNTAEPSNSIYLLVPGAAPAEPRFSWKSFRFAIKDALKSLLGRPRHKQNPELIQARLVSELINRLQEHVPGLTVRHSAGLRDGLAAAAADLKLDAVFLAMRFPKPRPTCALIGYVPDYQHKHLSHLFSKKEAAGRDKIFGQLVPASDAMVMNARAVAEDMIRFTPKATPALYALPFAPNLNPEWLQDRPELLAHYEIDGPYFIVCNQFWVHKDHSTAFRAFAEIAKRRPDVSLICTGGTTDYRDPTYFGKLEAEAARLGLGSQLRFLGHVPKRDQIELLKHAVALVQPTLFEGGPGGGSTYEAVALGQRVLLSDLPVNLEIDGGDVRFFKCGDHVALSTLMETVLGEAPALRDHAALLARSNARLRRNGVAIWATIRAAIATRKVSA